MNSIDRLTSHEVQKFILDNINGDINKLLLKKSPFSNVSIQEIAQQIKGKQIAEKKIPFLMKEAIIFPPHLNLEQSSSEYTAKYKATLLKGSTFIDLTAGFGIDAYFISQNFDKTFLVEKNTDLLEIVQHNWKILGKNAQFFNTDLENFIEKNQQKFDTIYIDPARRDANKKKVFLLEDLSPNILEIKDKLLQISNQILIKLSPLIDISYLISVISEIKEIHIVAVKNEVKEVLVLIEKNNNSQPVVVKCVNLETSEPDFIFNLGEKKAEIEFSEPLDYLYIPNNSVLKSLAFNEIANKFSLKKLHQNTHFYTSDKRIENFVGRVLKIKSISSKNLEKGQKFNIISKNYPLKPEEIKKKYKINDGGEQYLIFTQSIKGKHILISE